MEGQEGQKKSFGISPGKLFSVVLLIARSLLFLVVFILTIVTLAVFAAKNDEIKDGIRIPILSPTYCMLFYTSDGYGSNDVCNFVMAGEAIVLVLLIATALCNILKLVIITKNKIGNIIYIFLVILIDVLTLIFSLCVAIVLSAGLRQTCETFESSIGTCDIPIAFKGNDPSDLEAVYFHSSLQAAVGCSWVQFILLFPLIAFDIAYLILPILDNKRSDDTNIYKLMK